MSIKPVLAIVFVSALVLPAQAQAYEDTGFDPDDRVALADDPDVQSTTRTVWTSDGRRYLRIRIRAFEELGNYWFVDVMLDTKGSAAFDVQMRFFNADHGGTACTAWRRERVPENRDLVLGRFHQQDRHASCRVRTGRFRLTKEVRWRIVSESGYGGTTEYAPDTGSYS